MSGGEPSSINLKLWCSQGSRAKEGIGELLSVEAFHLQARLLFYYQRLMES